MPAPEAVCCRVRRHQVQDLAENLLLDAAQPLFGNFDQAQAAASFGDPAIVVVLQARLRIAPQAPFVGEPIERADRFIQPCRHRANCRQCRQRKRGKPRRLWRSQGWIDATRHLYPKEKIYTFWVNANAFARNAGFRMDFLLLSPSLVNRLVDTAVDSEHRGREKPSDHAPVWITLSRP